jgi:hypothetical protein
MQIIKISALIISAVLIIALTACQNSPSGVSSTAAPSSTAATSTIGSNAPSPTTGLTTTPSTTPILSTSPTTVIPGSTGIPPMTNISNANVGVIPRTDPTRELYIVFAWNDLGMHCANPTYDTAILLPPYNTLWAQVVKRGSPPQVVTQGIIVSYRIVNNTYSYGKASFSEFWTNAQKLFGATLAKNTGLNLSDPNTHNGLADNMAIKSDHFEAVGIPLTPIDDSNVWNPYQVAEITVKDSSGNVLAQTRTTAPISDEINCSKCHGKDAFNNILQSHDAKNSSNLVNSKPVLCVSCHGDPALGAPVTSGIKYLSDAVHGFHSTLPAQPACYDCHPGQVTQCNRSLAHTTADGNCTACHGNLAQVSSSISSGNRTPWASEPKCSTCHSSVDQVDTGTTLYRNATGHGGVYCASCHSSPHAMVPTSQQADNYQAVQYQGKALPIADCKACHNSSRGAGNLREYMEEHGGSNPERPNGCNICHMSVNSTSTSLWPHSFQWKNR